MESDLLTRKIKMLPSLPITSHYLFFISLWRVLYGAFILHYTIIFPPVVCCLPASDSTTFLYYFRGGQFFSPFSPSSSNLFGDWIQLTTPLFSTVFFGTTVTGNAAFIRSFRLLRNIIKIGYFIIPTTAGIGCSWLLQAYYLNVHITNTKTNLLFLY